MLKTLLLVVAGLVAGLAIAFWLQPGFDPVEAEAASGTPAAARSDANDLSFSEARLAALEDRFAAEVDQRVELETRVAELSAQLEALGQSPARGPRAGQSATNGPDPAIIEQRARRRELAATPEGRERLMIERLTAAGFAPDRAEWINRRTEELRMKALQEQYDARREGRAPAGDFGDNILRTELGEADYERYRTAMGQPTSAGVGDVLASSPAERAGLLPGDEIVAYGGTRVFDVGELNALTLEGTSGESIIIDVRRDGQNMQLVIPRGPLGITAGVFRGRPGFQR
jgi:hypothetical protein